MMSEEEDEAGYCESGLSLRSDNRGGFSALLEEEERPNSLSNATNWSRSAQNSRSGYPRIWAT